MVESGEIEMGIFCPPNITWTSMRVGAAAGAASPPSAIVFACNI